MSAWVTGEPRRVLRVGSVARIRQELAAHEAAARCVPVPQVLDHAVAGSVGGLLLEWLPGEPALELARSQPELAGRIGLSCGALHRRLASAEAPEALRRIDPARGSLALLHLDLHPLNVLVDPAGTVSGVLDWANAGGGDPELDRARSWSILTLDPTIEPFVGQPWWRDLVDGWAAAGRFAALTADARAWACRFMLADLGRRYPPKSLRRLSEVLAQTDREAAAG